MLKFTGTNRIFCAGSYFASVKYVVAFKKLGMKSIGVVKTATNKFPLLNLSQIELEIYGFPRAVILNNDPYDGYKVLMFVWINQYMR